MKQPIDWYTHRCADCGLYLDQFGICVLASPQDAAIMTAPVNCGRPATQVIAFKTAMASAINGTPQWVN